MADPQRLGQVLDLLIDNAVRHSPDGGEIALAAERRADGWRVWVTDEGPGLPQESVARLFHPFHAETSSGAGLGLSLARALVERMHGRIGVDGRRARGAAFWFTVPASSRA